MRVWESAEMALKGVVCEDMGRSHLARGSGRVMEFCELSNQPSCSSKHGEYLNKVTLLEGGELAVSHFNLYGYV
jgi:hypothetical protein